MDLTFINLIPTITELSDECDLPTKDEYMRQTTKEQLENYLIRDVIGIVQAYTDWKDFYGEALFSVPLQKFKDRTDILFFRRTDKQDYEISWSIEHPLKIPGHFELLSNLVNFDIDIVDSDPKTRYLVACCPLLEIVNEKFSETERKSLLNHNHYEEFTTTLDFRSPSYVGVQTVDASFTRMGNVVQLSVQGVAPEGTIKTSQGLMFSMTIPQRFQPSGRAYYFPTTVIINDGICRTDVDGNMIDNLAVLGLVRVSRNIIIMASEKYTNVQKFGFQMMQLQWYI